jgi:SAM-dependent methyltransferase
MIEKQASQKLPPVWLINAINAFRTFLIRLNRNLFPGNVVLYEQFQYFWLLPSLYVATRLDIATLLKNNPLTPEELSRKVNADATNLARLLRALASQGIFKQTRDGRFALNGMAKGLLDEPGSLRYMILHHLGPVNWNLMSNLEYAVRTGGDAFEEKYGLPIYEYLKEHQGENDVFDKSMSNLSDLGLWPILSAYDFGKFKTIADIGGGEGFLLANILHQYPGCKGLLFDTPNALEQAEAMLVKYQVDRRTELVAGDFFTSVPGTGDLYLLKHVIHNWNDLRSEEVLKVIHRDMPAGSRLLILEMIVPPGNTPSLAKLLDIQMMASMPGGKERTAAGFTEMLTRSGFRNIRIIHTVSPVCLIEAVKQA